MVPVGELLVERYGLSTDPERQGDIPTYDEALFVPPVAIPSIDLAPRPPSGGRSVVVSLSQQALWAYDGGGVVRSTYISTGTEKFRTPAGLYYVNSKIDSQTMAGVLGGEYYNVPDVPYVMYFTDRGHALHGTYWHENFGVPMSHGCVNLPMDVAEWMYGWAPMGMPVLIVD
jgi:lipoprotein-anchoring transpeptidase ErfK/SrfK